MPSDLAIDFQRIRSFNGSQHHAFEELCSQLAALEPRTDDAAFYRKGLGADAGVECFVRHEDGAETGWQAKYFFKFGETQIQQLDSSIKKALTEHPRLNHYIVCIPFNLRDPRGQRSQTDLQRWETWTKKWIKAAAKKGRPLKLSLWGSAELVERLGRDNPLYSGRASFWFDETVFTKAWFQERFGRARDGLGQRYTPETNVELPIRRAILGFCRDPILVDELGRWLQNFEEARYRVIGDYKELVAGFGGAATTDLESATATLSALLAKISDAPERTFPLDRLASAAGHASLATARAMRQVWDIKTEDAKVQERIRHLNYGLNRVSDAIDNVLSGLEDDRWRIANDRRLLVTGDAGVGKSHLFADAVDYQVSRERPAILILGGTMIDDDPWTQIVGQLGLQLTPEKLLGALDAAAEAAGTRAVIFIDAINERHGIALWSHRLPSFLKVIEPFPRVAVALSCRSTYLPYILRDGPIKGLPQIKHIGFAGRAAEAARYYLDRRGIVRMAAPNLVPEFENPLFLKTCCDFLEKEGLHEVPRGLRGVTEIFGFYTQAVAKAVETRLGLDRNLHIVSRSLEALAAALESGERGYLEYAKAAELLENILPSHGQFERSLMAQLSSEGILAVEPVTGNNGATTQIVRFTFERYSDHRIARQILKEHLNVADPATCFSPGTPLHTYLNSDDAYEYAGVIEAMAIQLPEQCAWELPDLWPRSPRNVVLLSEAFTASVLWRDQKRFTQRTLELLREFSNFTGRNEELRTLIAVTTEPDNAFNARFLHERLLRLPMPERDRKWSIYLAREADDEDSPVETLIVWTAQNGLEAIEENRAELTAIALSWLFSTSNRVIRDRATKALAALLSTRLGVAVRLIEQFKGVDDLYVLERVFAAAYGGALQGMTVEGLGDLAAAAYSCVFDREHALVHVLIRDYARGIVEMANHRGVLSASIDLAKARPPYRSGAPIEDVPESVVEAFQQDYPGGHRFTDQIVGSTVHDGDFARYVIDGPVGQFSSLPIAWAGRSQEDIYRDWESRLARENPVAAERLQELIAVCDQWRKEQDPRSPMELIFSFKKPGDVIEKEERSPFEKKIVEAEERLREALGNTGWQEYCDQARSYVRSGLHWARHVYPWPPSYNCMRARRWVCKRAHDLGWTPERFAEFDRNLGHGDRYDHRVERIGKKYQWLAFHEALARIGDTMAFAGWINRDGTRIFQGPWEVNRRDIDPSLLAARTKGEQWVNWDPRWWMPAKVKLKAVTPLARLAWLNGPNDFVSDATLVSVTDPKSNRRWLVLSEFVGWHDWGMREGERTLDRTTWFNLICLVVRAKDRPRLIKRLSGAIFNQRHQMPELDKPGEGYIGEYPWHPLYTGLPHWVAPDQWNKLGVAVLPLVTDYFAERGGYDYSIEESLRINVPAPGLIAGLKLHLSNGRELNYADDSNSVLFFDPSTEERGPGAALVDRDAFLAYLKREQLEAVWIISGEKSTNGGKKYQQGYGGARQFTSIYWLTQKGFQRRDHFDRHNPSEEQLKKFFDEPGAEMLKDISPRRTLTEKPKRTPKHAKKRPLERRR